jgi:hypothetical protein
VKEMTEQTIRMKPDEDGIIEPPLIECPQCGCKHHICVRIEVGTDWDFSTKSVVVEIEEYD